MNIYEYITPPKGEIFDNILQHKNIQITRIISSENITPKEYNQDVDEWVIVIEGGAILDINGERKSLQKGDSILIRAHTPHTVLSTVEDTIWLAIYIS